MFISPSTFLIESAYNVECFESLSIIDSCYNAFNESVDSKTVIDTATKHTTKFLFELLDHVRDGLMAIYQKVISFLNNYILNSAKLADKYRELILERYERLDHSLQVKTYQYKNLFDEHYPTVVDSGTIRDNAEKLRTSVNKKLVDMVDLHDKVDEALINFSINTIGEAINLDDIDNSITDIVTHYCRGREIIKNITKDTLIEYLDQIKEYKKLKSAINSTKRGVLEDYKNIKRAMMDELKADQEATLGVAGMINPSYQTFANAEYNRFADINFHFSRMFDGYIRIYNKAFSTKFKILRDKINENKEVITRIMTETSVFAAINPHGFNSQKKYKSQYL